MAIALRDAQHLSWKTFIKLEKTLGPNRSKQRAPLEMIVALLKAAGEVASAVRMLEELKPPEKVSSKEKLANELSDVLFMVFVLAEHYGIELEETFMQTINDRFMSMM